MEVPILKQGDLLIVTVLSVLSDSDLLKMRDNLQAQVRRFRSRGVILDITALDVVDSFACNTLRNIGQMLRLQGARTVIVGIQPEVAFAMTQMGLTLEGVETALDLDDGLGMLRRETPAGGHGR